MLLPWFCCSELAMPSFGFSALYYSCFFQLSVSVPYSESAKPFVNPETSLTVFSNGAVSAS